MVVLLLWSWLPMSDVVVACLLLQFLIWLLMVAVLRSAGGVLVAICKHLSGVSEACGYSAIWGVTSGVETCVVGVLISILCKNYSTDVKWRRILGDTLVSCWMY